MIWSKADIILLEDGMRFIDWYMLSGSVTKKIPTYKPMIEAIRKNLWTGLRLNDQELILVKAICRVAVDHDDYPKNQKGYFKRLLERLESQPVPWLT